MNPLAIRDIQQGLAGGEFSAQELAHLTRFGSMESTLTLRSNAVATEH